MKRGKLHSICAYPMIITWAIGAIILNSVIFTNIYKSGNLLEILTDSQSLWILSLFLIGTIGFGFVLGVIFIWPLVRKICSKFNGGPLHVGDQVEILIGPRQGQIANVYEITFGQGGWEQARLDLGQESKIAFTDIYEVYSLFRIREGEQAAPSNR